MHAARSILRGATLLVTVAWLPACGGDEFQSGTGAGGSTGGTGAASGSGGAETGGSGGAGGTGGIGTGGVAGTGGTATGGSGGTGGTATGGSGGTGGTATGGSGGAAGGAAGAAGSGGGPPDLHVAWLVGIHGSGGQRPTGVHRAPEGVIVGGHYGKEILIGNDTGLPATTTRMFVTQLDATGGVSWLRTYGGTGEAYLSASVAVDGSGTIYAAGMFKGTMTLGPTPLTAGTDGTFDGFVARFASDGVANSAFRLGGPGDNSPWGRVALTGNSPLVAGYFQGDLSVANQTLSSEGNGDGFVSRLYSTSDWAMSFGDSGKQTVLDIHSRGTVVAFTGQAEGIFTVGGKPVSAAGGTDILLAASSPAGEVSFAKVYGDGEPQGGRGVFVTPDAIYLTGESMGDFHFDDQAVGSNGDFDMFVSRHDLAGKCLWARSFGGNFADAGHRVLVTASGDVFVVGTFRGEVDFGFGPVTAAGRDIVLLRLDKSGTLLGAIPFGGPGDDEVSHMEEGPASQVVVTGSFAQSLSVLGHDLHKVVASDADVDGFVLSLLP